jgi:hypothetical protein
MPLEQRPTKLAGDLFLPGCAGCRSEWIKGRLIRKVSETILRHIMNKRRFKMSHRDPLGKVYIVAMTLMSALLVLPLPLYAQETDPVAVVMARAEVFNAGDVEAAVAFFANDAVYNIIPPPPGVPGTYTGQDEIRGRITDIVALNAAIEIELRQVEGDKVTTLTRYVDDGLRGLGLTFIEGIEEYIVRDGKITSYTWTTTEESMSQLMVVEPHPEALPETGGQILPTYPWVTVWGGLAFLAGLGLAIRRRRLPQ